MTQAQAWVDNIEVIVHALAEEQAFPNADKQLYLRLAGTVPPELLLQDANYPAEPLLEAVQLDNGRLKIHHLISGEASHARQRL